MRNLKLVGIIVATAITTATAVLLVLQRSRKKNRMRFDSAEFDDDDFMNDIYNCNVEDLDVDFPGSEEDTLEQAAETAEEVVKEVKETISETVDKLTDAVNEVVDDVNDALEESAIDEE